MSEPQQDINLNYVSPVVASDGHIIMISDQGVPSVLFFQARQAHEGHIHGDVVAGVRLNSIEELKNLAKSINETIKNHQTREP